jgi:hypothetical protein
MASDAEYRARYGMTPEAFARLVEEWGPLDDDGVPEKWGTTLEDERKMLSTLDRVLPGDVDPDAARSLRLLRAKVFAEHVQSGASRDELTAATGLSMRDLKRLLGEAKREGS